MTPDIEPIFPDQISDRTAAILSDILYALAADCESRYISQLRRYYARNHDVYDPDHPWISRPTDSDL